MGLVWLHQNMPKRKDPSIPVRVAVATTQWPGATAQEVEQQVTRPVEQTVAQNAFIRPPVASDFGIRSISFPGLSIVYVQLDDSVVDTKRQFSDINLKLNTLNPKLPQGAGPIQFNPDFGDTAAMMLTIASSPAGDVEVALRTQTIQAAIERVRATESSKAPQPRVSVVYAFPQSVAPELVRDSFDSIVQAAVRNKVLVDPHFFQGSGFIGTDASSKFDDAELRALADRFISERLHQSEVHPDAWLAIFVRDPQTTQARFGRPRW